MCCFSPISAPVGLLSWLFPPKLAVAGTQIFARLADAPAGERHDPREQWIVYSMELSVAGQVAMILPLPVAPGAGEAGVRFVSLEKRPGFFDELARLFLPPGEPKRRGPPLRFAPQSAKPRLIVHEVGAFVASYVPTIDDFDRLDPRFRLPRKIWSDVGGYDDHGFAVFQLAAKGKSRVHPMAFRFATRDPRRLFFPTVHVHDGRAHAEAEFDHTLFWQDPSLHGRRPAAGDEASDLPAPPDPEGVLLGDAQVHKRALRGSLPNRDTWVPIG